MIRVTVWNEYIHEREYEAVGKLYPSGIHGCIAEFLGKYSELSLKTVTLDMPENGLTDEVLKNTDVLIWWGHCAHDKVSDEIAERVKNYILGGMGFIALHSAHLCKPLKMLLGTTMSLNWRNDDRERLWCANPSHPIAKGIPSGIEIPTEEMYGEFFDIPKPDDVIFLGWFSGGEVFRSGCTFTRGMGKIFYFQPGHEAYPTYYIPEIQKIIANAVFWAKSENSEIGVPVCKKVPPKEKI